MSETTSTSTSSPRVLRGGRSGETSDPRVRAVLEVLAGESSATVAARWSVDQALLFRWVRAFVEAGSAQVTNRPAGDIARQRDRFLSTFMHGLRAPMAVAQMWVGLLRDGHHNHETTQEMVAHLQDTLDLVDDRALDVELLTAAMLGRLSLEPQAVDVARLARLVAPPEDVDPAAADLAVAVDPALFPRVLRDLWEVATETYPPPERVHVEVQRKRPWVEIRVVREGAPIDPGSLQQLYEPFDRPDGSVTVTIGLYLARALTVVHGGTLGVEQDQQRTSLWVRVPEVPPDRAAGAVTSTAPHDTGDTT